MKINKFLSANIMMNAIYDVTYRYFNYDSDDDGVADGFGPCAIG